MPLVNTLSTPMSCCTFTDLPRKYPMKYWPDEATSLRTKLRKMARTMPPQKPRPSISRAWSERMMPEQTYTGMPGTGGSMNMMKPIQKKMNITNPNSTFPSASFSHDKKTYDHLETPIKNTQYTIASQFALTKMLDQFQPFTALITLIALSVNKPSLVAVPRRLRAFCFMMFRSKNVGIRQFKAMTAAARARSDVAIFTSAVINFEFVTAAVMVRFPISK
mmetsp:Transcript_7887/g.17389  ORF Transcript_7887/g.17389 Transcript_7887/m.17389 type:complete len:220 (+) Transcript_7887:1005-1664(+)